MHAITQSLNTQTAEALEKKFGAGLGTTSFLAEVYYHPEKENDRPVLEEIYLVPSAKTSCIRGKTYNYDIQPHDNFKDAIFFWKD